MHRSPLKSSVMKKITCAVFFLLLLLRLPAQNITAAEYFFDTDPGKGLGIPVSVGASGPVVNFTASISTASLSAGFHTLAIRTKDAVNTWGLFETRAFYISTSTTNAGIITDAEYFIDADPGQGAGTHAGVGTSGNVVNFGISIPTASLANGFHTLAIRTKNADGQWGLFETRAFYISSSSSNATAVTAAEYFIDADPGSGNGTAVSVGATGNTVNFTASIPTTALSTGFHTLAIRTKNQDGQWGLFETRAFYISTSTTDAPPITAAEFFMDADPGPGNGTALAIGSSGNTVTFTSLIPTTSLAVGFHTLAIRTRNAAGQWGLFDTRAFYISTSAADMGMITNAEYFIDTDPGVGNGSTLTVNTPGNTINQTFLANVPSGTATGQHLLAIRTRDINGNWGLFEVAQFTVAGNPLPLDWISFTGNRQDSKVVLKWVTENEVNTSHFVVERSNNGIDFTRMGDVSAKGNAHNEYAFDDLHPFKGANFYRLKQVDQNGVFKYSAIVKVYFSDDATNTMRLYPNPAKTTVFIEFSGREKDVIIQLYDAAGKMVYNNKMVNQTVLPVPVSNLSKGMYWITVSDGITLQRGSFVKE
jgi:hypothetical protein